MHIIGISGGSGSGKTTILHALRNSFSKDEVAVISQDDYYLPVDRSQENHLINFDQPEALDLDRLASDIQSLRAGGTVKRKEYTFNNAASEAAEIEVHAASVLLVEGLFVFHHEAIRLQCDQLVFIEADKDIRFKRRLQRDMEERGYSEESIRFKWDEQVELGYVNYLEVHRDKADLLIDSNISVDNGIDRLTKMICATLQ